MNTYCSCIIIDIARVYRKDINEIDAIYANAINIKCTKIKQNYKVKSFQLHILYNHLLLIID